MVVRGQGGPQLAILIIAECQTIRDTDSTMAFTKTTSLALLRVIVIAAVLLAAAATEAAEAEPQGPITLGAYFGSLAQFQPGAKILVVYAEGDVSLVTWQTLEAEKRNPAHYIHKTRHEQIVRLLELAKKLAIQHQAPAYALANLHVNTSVTSNGIIVETWGDLLGVQPPP